MVYILTFGLTFVKRISEYAKTAWSNPAMQTPWCQIWAPGPFPRRSQKVLKISLSCLVGQMESYVYHGHEIV